MPAPTPPDGESRKLSEFICFAVYSANLAFGRAYKPILDELGLTYTQYIALVALAEGDEQTVSALGEKLFLESNTLTPILKKLESLGYVVRGPAPAGRRAGGRCPTAAGRGRVDRDPGAALFDATGLGDDFATMQKAVVTLRDNLLRAGKARPAA